MNSVQQKKFAIIEDQTKDFEMNLRIDIEQFRQLQKQANDNKLKGKIIFDKDHQQIQFADNEGQKIVYRIKNIDKQNYDILKVKGEFEKGYSLQQSNINYSGQLLKNQKTQNLKMEVNRDKIEIMKDADKPTFNTGSITLGEAKNKKVKEQTELLKVENDFDKKKYQDKIYSLLVQNLQQGITKPELEKILKIDCAQKFVQDYLDQFAIKEGKRQSAYIYKLNPNYSIK